MSLLNGLVGYWKCDEASGNLLDAHGSNPFVENWVIGPTSGVTGKINNGRELESDWNNQYFYITDNADVSLGTDTAFALRGVFKPAGNGNTGHCMMFTKYTSPTSDNQCEYRLAFANSAWQFDVGNGSSSASVKDTSYGTHVAGVWEHIFAWYDPISNIIGIQVNGLTPVTTSWSGGTQNTTGNLYLNTQTNVLGNNAHQLDGVLDELAFWKDVVMSASDGTTLWDSGNVLGYDDFGGDLGATIGVASEINSSLVVGKSKSKTLGQSQEVNSGLAFTKTKS
jgi:hypothetical protein